VVILSFPHLPREETFRKEASVVDKHGAGSPELLVIVHYIQANCFSWFLRIVVKPCNCVKPRPKAFAHKIGGYLANTPWGSLLLAPAGET